ncbi:BrnA antitoxin family protein [Sphingopyxis fribergensis]
MKEEHITSKWIDPDDAPKLDRDWFAGAELREGTKVVRRGRPPSDSKRAVSLRLDTDLLEWFKDSGPGWQTRINDILRKAAKL